MATHSGKTALAVSKRRQATPTLGVALRPRVAGRLALQWGVVPMLLEDAPDSQAALERAVAWARGAGLVSAGDRIGYFVCGFGT